MQGWFRIERERDACLIRLTMGGFFDSATIIQMRQELVQAISILSFPANTHITLCDIREMDIQSQERVEEFSQLVGSDDVRSRRLGVCDSEEPCSLAGQKADVTRRRRVLLRGRRGRTLASTLIVGYANGHGQKPLSCSHHLRTQRPPALVASGPGHELLPHPRPGWYFRSSGGRVCSASLFCAISGSDAILRCRSEGSSERSRRP